MSKRREADKGEQCHLWARDVLGIFARCYASFTDVLTGLMSIRGKEIDCLAFRSRESG